MLKFNRTQTWSQMKKTKMTKKTKAERNTEIQKKVKKKAIDLIKYKIQNVNRKKNS